MLSARSRQCALFGLAFGMGCVATLAIVLLLSFRNESNVGGRALVLPSIADCVSKSGILAREEKLSVSLVKDVQSLCYDQIYGQGLLNDFQLRRLAFVEQAKAETVILWMVVIITLSGVLIAGLQVFASYKLAVAGNRQFDSSELSIERDKLSVKSSIAGLFILIISFAFFYVFVLEIYKIHPIDVDSKSNSQQPAYVGEITTAPTATKPASGK